MGFIRDIELFKQFLIWNVQTKPQAVRHYSYHTMTKPKSLRISPLTFCMNSGVKSLSFSYRERPYPVQHRVESYGELDNFGEKN